jgi:hypothetical protein
VRGRWAAAATIAGALGVGALVLGIARVSGFALSWPIALLTGLATAGIVVLGLGLPTADPVPPAPADRPTPPARSSFGDLTGLRAMVEADAQDPYRFETRLRPRLVAVATERLWQHHGLDWRTEEGRAAALPLLGPGVAALLTAPPGSLPLTPDTLTSWTRELEAL